ncbi:phosphoesterase PA-phosphatase related protein [Gemmatirosa kalamazoonensis]|uniref:Phosphoesterase PA-phosphatase related protein n=1 Tax=Gemmatirosa kalamazoonensis TaxID=861299 RepID=W0RDA4_9BACT|nr:vanadium-dependent haloperoxidase [Gemmatirosa kalamazoonensis]AHG88422.1 phosphoesterase PA-phosphatase related protein [Gemmatirosa kalamazoonensis]
MTSSIRTLVRACALVVSPALAACSDGATATPDSTAARTVSVGATASVRWNQRAVALVVARQPASNGQAAVSRILTYLSLAQYRAAAAAQGAQTTAGAASPSVSAAVGGASAAVLDAFFPLDVASIEAQLNADLAVPPWPGAAPEDVVGGQALGRRIGTAVLAQADRDNYLAASPGTPPVGPSMWVSSSAAIVRSLYGVRPFFLRAPNELRPPAPPAIGSPKFVEALAEVRRIADTRTAEQTAIATNWNTSSGTFTAGALNLVADDVIREHGAPELDAARVLAFANAAAFDAQIACWDAKFAYWFIRPSQADPGIALAIALPNHPSYPSGHSCMTAALFGVLANAFPDQRARLDAMVDEAGMSRVYGGIHYRFDIDAGRDIGRAAAALALNGSLK